MSRDRDDPVLIYLADLTHTGLQVATESTPLNIGLVASYAKKWLGEAVEIRLFKYPEKLAAALKERLPDLLGCSNYVWNSNLSEWVLGYAKRLSPAVVTVQGGTNYPFDAEGQREFLSHHPHTDFHIFYEGEVAFLNLLRRFLETGSVDRMKDEPMAGCQFLSPRDGSLVSGPPVERLRALDEIPSPYVTGLLDEFFDGRLTPMMETTRGCPFTCNFCNAGDRYFNTVAMFSLDYIREELCYIAPRIAATGVSHLTIADNNFGMYPRDAEICRIIREAQDRYGWPLGLISTTGKNNKERIIKATEILGRSLLVSMSVQSMDRDVLVNIRRQNISLETYKEINQALVRQGRSGMAELIFPLPGETYDSFMRGIQAAIEAGAGKIMSYTLQLLYGTDYRNPDYRRRHGYQGKWRLIPLDFGEYEGEHIFDVEEVAVSSRYAGFQDYLLIRGFALLTECLYNNYLFWELLRYLQDEGVSPYAWMRAVWDTRERFPEEIRRVFDSFLEETQRELFETEAELIRFYSDPERYARLLRGEIGGNVIFKHKTRLITQHRDVWMRHITQVATALVLSSLDSTAPRSGSTLSGVEGSQPDAASQAGRVTQELEELLRYLTQKFHGMLDPAASEEPITDRFQHDILTWSRDQTGRRLSDYVRPEGCTYRFYFSEQQQIERRDSFRRYGTDPHGLAKIMARIPSHERLFRQVSPVGEPAARLVEVIP